MLRGRSGRVGGYGDLMVAESEAVDGFRGSVIAGIT
jgi:hypothetical protein